MIILYRHSDNNFKRLINFKVQVFNHKIYHKVEECSFLFTSIILYIVNFFLKIKHKTL
jgi:hypothetical protein